MSSPEEGKKLIEIARRAIQAKLLHKDARISDSEKAVFGAQQGVFVTLKKDAQLRGCIGFPEPTHPLYRGVVLAAQSAAFSDPRFPPIDKDEYPILTIEVSVLSVPRMVEVRNPEELLSQVEVGRDGLIVRGTFNSGLLLPQVAVEYGWDSKQFLFQVCMKAGLPGDSWQNFDQCRIYRFQSTVFSEVSPGGAVKQLL